MFFLAITKSRLLLYNWLLLNIHGPSANNNARHSWSESSWIRVRTRGFTVRCLMFLFSTLVPLSGLTEKKKNIWGEKKQNKIWSVLSPCCQVPKILMYGIIWNSTVPVPLWGWKSVFHWFSTFTYRKIKMLRD